MMELSAVPTPGNESGGGAGNQQPGVPGDIKSTPAPMEGELLPRTVIDLIAVSPHHYGGDQVGPMISAIINDAQYDKEQARKQVAEIQSRLDKANAELVEEKLKNARLGERLIGYLHRSRYEKLSLFCSPIAFSAAIDLEKADSSWWIPLAALGLVLLAVNFLPSKGKD